MQLRINRQIKVKQVQLISNEGKNLGNFLTNKAWDLAQEQGLDLVEINPNSNPPCCKIIDYGRYLYEQKKLGKNQSKAPQIKELKLTPQIDDNDLLTRLDHAAKFLGKGYIVKITMEYKKGYQRKLGMGNPILEKFTKPIIESTLGTWDGTVQAAKNGISIILKPI